MESGFKNNIEMPNKKQDDFFSFPLEEKPKCTECVPEYMSSRDFLKREITDVPSICLFHSYI